MLYLLLKYPSVHKLCKNFDSNLLSEGFVRTVYTKALELIESGFDTDVSGFSQYLSDKEMSQLIKIVNDINDSKNSEQEFRECLEAIKNESKSNLPTDIDKLNPDEFNSLFEGLNK